MTKLPCFFITHCHIIVSRFESSRRTLRHNSGRWGHIWAAWELPLTFWPCCDSHEIAVTRVGRIEAFIRPQVQMNRRETGFSPARLVRIQPQKRPIKGKYFDLLLYKHRGCPKTTIVIPAKAGIHKKIVVKKGKYRAAWKQGTFSVGRSRRYFAEFIRSKCIKK